MCRSHSAPGRMIILYLFLLSALLCTDANPSVSCTFNMCSLNHPCVKGTCNNGFCCGLAMAKSKIYRRSKGSTLDMKPSTLNSTDPLLQQNDWPGPTNNMNNMFDSAKPDTSMCIGGFTSSIRCGAYDNCPPGLLCEQGIKFCCPMILPVESKPTRRPLFHNYRNTATPYNSQPSFYNMPSTMSSYGPINSYSGLSYNNINYPRMMHRYNNYFNNMNEGLISNYRPRNRIWSSYPCNANTDNCGYYNNYGTSNGYEGISGSFGPMSSLGTGTTENNVDGCAQGTEGGSCVQGRCDSGYQCNRNNVCCQTEVPATVCPDGTQAAGGCVNGQCGFGFTCNQGLCCTNTSQTPRCLDGSQAIGACIGGKCGDGYACTTGNICCPSNMNGCPAGTASIGPCVNGACPNGFSCVNDQCCGPPNLTNATNLLIQCSQADSSGPCSADGQCSDPGFQCDVTNQWCCPNIAGDPVGPCIRGEGGTRLCPDGYACSGPDAGQCYRLDTGTCAPVDQYGPCSQTEPRCPNGYTCIGGFCCSDNAPTYLRKKRSHLRPEMDESTKETLKSIPLFKKNAGPRDGDMWVSRLAEELQTLIELTNKNKQGDADWFNIESSPDGTRWFGKCWYFHNMKKYEFDFEFDLPVTYPKTAPEIAIPSLDGKTAKMYRGGKICLSDHFKPLWARNVPKFGIAHALTLGLGPWLAVEVPSLIERGVLEDK
uniref:Ubiquitin-fold modifier-conjugating enzyme 1 n=1 Tax=Bursaphelenchus xylophilus TaxID=6326 RepID=A0A1I7SSX3_BURXY